MNQQQRLCNIVVIVVVLLTTTIFHPSLRKTTTASTTTLAKATTITTNKDNDDATNNNHNLFLPGSLNMTRLETLQRCYIDPKRYKFHLQTPEKLHVSQNHQLIYRGNPKAGSTGSRQRMQTYFPPIDPVFMVCRDDHNQTLYEQYQNYFTFTFVREPTQHFVSGYKEMLLRWQRFYEHHPAGHQPPAHLQQFASNVTQLDHQNDADGVRQAFESFVTEHYHGYLVPNNHVSFQSTRLLPRKEHCIELDTIYDLEDMNHVFESMLQKHNKTNVTKIIQGKLRHKPYHIDKPNVSLRVKHKICHMLALDYCCLNYKLPEECDGILSCRWKKKSSESDVMLIEPISSYYPKNMV